MPLAHDQIIQRADSTSPAAGGSLDAMMYRIWLTQISNYFLQLLCFDNQSIHPLGRGHNWSGFHSFCRDHALTRFLYTASNCQIETASICLSPHLWALPWAEFPWGLAFLWSATQTIHHSSWCYAVMHSWVEGPFRLPLHMTWVEGPFRLPLHMTWTTSTGFMHMVPDV